MAQLGALTSPTSVSSSGFPRGPRPLTEICLKIAIKNIDQIGGLGDLPAEYAVKMLRYVKNPEHLHALELDSPTDDIYDQTEEYWVRFIQRHFPALVKEHNFQPKEKRHWHKVYEKYKKMRDKQVEEATNVLAEKMAASRDEKRHAKILSVPDAKRLPMPRERQSTGRSPHWSTMSREKQSFLSKTKKQLAAQHARFKINTPVRRAPIGHVLSAPASMVRDARVGRQFDPSATLTSTTTIRPARKQSTQANSEAERQRGERESRLLSIKGKSAQPANVISFSDDEEDEYRDAAGADDLFGGSETDNSTRGGALSIDDLESTDFSASSSASRVQRSQTRSARHRGSLLSASPGANLKIPIVTSPPLSAISRRATTDRAPPLSPPLNSQGSAGGPSAGSSNPPSSLPRKRKPADVFMRPNKRVR